MDNEILKVTRNEGTKNIPTAFIFSCPGQEELKSGKLVNGQTGKNLDMMLTFLNKKMPELFPSVNRYDYRITNSSECVHYKAYDNRTEPKTAEITDQDNLSRLADDINGYKCVITFGRCAALAAKALDEAGMCKNTVFPYSQHLSFLSLNSSIKKDIHGNDIIRGAADSTYKRLEVAAQKILDQLERQYGNNIRVFI